MIAILIPNPTIIVAVSQSGCDASQKNIDMEYSSPPVRQEHNIGSHHPLANTASLMQTPHKTK